MKEVGRVDGGSGRGGGSSTKRLHYFLGNINGPCRQNSDPPLVCVIRSLSGLFWV